MADPAYVSLLHQRTGVVELRAFGVGGDKNVCGRFDDPDALVKAATRLSGHCSALYTTLNQISDEALTRDEAEADEEALTARRENRPVTKFLVNNDYSIGALGIRDEHISRRLWLPFDFDSTARPKELSASDEEIDQARNVASYIKDEFTKKGWPDPILGMSGNGCHLLYAVDLAAGKDTNYMVRRLFLHLAHHVKMTVAPTLGADIKFDSVNHNLSRIWKLYGTLTMKGEPSDERPHREAACILPSQLEIVPKQLLLDYAGAPGSEKFWQDALRDRKPGKKAPTVDEEGRERHKIGKGDYSTCDIVRLFEDKDMYRFAMREGGKHSVYCPWADEHSSEQHAQGSDTIIWEPDPDGGDERQWPVFHCSHDACGEGGADGKRTFDSVRKVWGNSTIDKYCGKKFDSFRSINEAQQELAAQRQQRSKASPSPSSTSQTRKMQRRTEEGATPPEVAVEAQPKSKGSNHADIPMAVRWRWLKWAGPKIEASELTWSHPDARNPDPSEYLEVEEPDRPQASTSTGEPVGASDHRPGAASSDQHIGLGGDASNTPEEVHANLVAILGTKFTYHIGWDILMAPDAVRHSFPKLGNEWLKSTERRAVRKEHFIFDPTRPRFDPENPHLLNRFTGFDPPENSGVYPELILQHLYYLCGEDDVAYDFVLKWHALQFQKIGTKMESALIFKGAHGTGKNILFTRICNDLFGKYGATITATQLSSQYNEWASCKLYIIANEVATKRDRVDVQNKLKALVSDEDLPVNAKFKDVAMEKNFFNLVMFSNQANPVTIEEGDRRYLLCEIAAPKSTEYYVDLGREIDAGGVYGLYHYLMKMDLTGFSRHTKPPMTQAKADSISDRLSPHDKFFDRLKKNDVEMEFRNLQHAGAIEKKDLWKAFQLWKSHHGYKSDYITNTVFCHRADRVLGKRRLLNVYVETPHGQQKRTQRTYYLLGPGAEQDKVNAQEVYLASQHFSECLQANVYATSQDYVETINTAPDKDWDKEMKLAKQPKKED